MNVEEQTVTLCFATPIWRLAFSDYEAVNAAIREQLAELGWAELDERQRAIVHPSHSFSEDRFVSVDEVPAIPISTPEITFKAEEGTMLIFPGWLPHKVPRNNSDRRRVSISFKAI